MWLPRGAALCALAALAAGEQQHSGLEWAASEHGAALRHPAVSSGGGVCSDDWSCSLGGTCSNGKCACDHWTTGPQCNLLNLAHLTRNTSSYGLQMPDYHSCEIHEPAAAWGPPPLQCLTP
jgi:hypothetical protein